MERNKTELKDILEKVKKNQSRFEHLIAKSTHFQNVIEMIDSQLIDCLDEEEALKNNLRTLKKTILTESTKHRKRA